MALFHPKIVLLLSIIILALHALALYQFYWYWTIPWFDMAMHAAGGFTAGILFFVLARNHVPIIFQAPPYAIIIAGVSVTALIGVGWELYEFLYDTFIIERNVNLLLQANVTDTLSDLFFDLLGGLIAALLFITSKKINIDK